MEVMSRATVIRAGDLDKLCTLEILQQTQSAHGGLVDTWVSIGEVWAQIVPMDSRAAYYASATNPAISSTAKVWYDENFVVDKSRLRYMEHIYIVRRAVDIEGKHIAMNLECEQQQVKVP